MELVFSFIISFASIIIYYHYAYMFPLLCKRRLSSLMSLRRCHHATSLRQSTTIGFRPLATKAAISMLLLLTTTFTLFCKSWHTTNTSNEALAN